MKRLEYYFDIDNKIVLAYNHQTEFFAKFVKNSNQWEKCKISFMQFSHDYNYKRITLKDALKLTKHKTPRKMFNEYLEMLNFNINGV